MLEQKADNQYFSELSKDQLIQVGTVKKIYKEARWQ